MTKENLDLLSPTNSTKRTKPINRNFIDTLNARMTRKLYEKSQRWRYNFATETAIDPSKENPQP